MIGSLWLWLLTDAFCGFSFWSASWAQRRFSFSPSGKLITSESINTTYSLGIVYRLQFSNFRYHQRYLKKIVSESFYTLVYEKCRLRNGQTVPSKDRFLMIADIWAIGILISFLISPFYSLNDLEYKQLESLMGYQMGINIFATRGVGLS